MADHLQEEVLPAAFSKGTQQTEEPQLTDIVQATLAGLALVFLSPLFLLLALAVRLTSPGPMLYRGARVGKDGKIFFIYKFRTLLDGAEKKIGARLLNEKDGDLYTPIGRFLKRSKLDELPQLLNVLKGDMCFVGPRPIRPIFLQQFLAEIPSYGERFRTKPGMTGLAQARGGYFTHPRNKLRYERIYIQHRSLLFDGKIILHTLLKICHRWLSLGFLLLALFLFVSFTPAALLSSFYVSVAGTRFNVIYGVMVLCGAWLLGRQLPSERLSVYRSPVYLPMGFFLLCSLTAAIFSPDPIQALRGAGYYVVTGFLITLGIVNSQITRGFVRRATNVVALTAVVISAIGLVKLLLTDYLTFANASGQTGAALLDHTPGITATLESPMVLAAYLTLAVPYLLYRLAQAQEPRERDFWVVGATITFIGILLTKTPVGLCALTLTVVLYMLKYSRPSLLVGFSCAISPFFFLSLSSYSVSSLFGLEGPLWETWRKMLENDSFIHLLVGYGVRTLKESWDIVQAVSGLTAPPDNAYATLFFENGILGELTLLWMIITVLRALYRAHQQAVDDEIRCLLWATFCSMIGFLVSLLSFNAFANLTLQILFWGIVGIGLGMVTHLNGKRKEFLLDLRLTH
jgi:lipopolysaccharide/colanic/teichoic acid biosynthesis glycosyltransferase